MQIWIHDSKMRKITALNNDIPDMLSYSNSAWHPYLNQATSTFDFTIPKFSNGELHEDIKLINDECFVSFYVNGSYQVFYIATLQEDDFNIQLTCNNTNLEYALEYANPFNSSSAQSIEWYLNHMDLLSFAAVEIGINEVSDRKRTLTFDSQETKMNRLQSLMSNFDAEFEFKTELNRDGTYKRIAINIYQKDGIGTDRKDVVLYYSNGLKGVQVTSDKTQMFNAGVFTGKDGLSLADVEISEKNADGIEEFYSRKGNPCLYAPLAMSRYPATMKPDEQDNWIRKDFTTEYENVNDLKAYALRTLKQYAYPLVTYTASVQSGFVSQYTDFKLGDTIRIIDKNFAGGLALEARVSEMVISFDNPTNNSFVFTNYRKFDNKPTSALQTRIDQAIESKLPYRIELATTGGVTFKNNEGETTVKPSLYKGNLPYTTDVTWRWALDGVVTVGMQYRIQAKDITDTAVLTVSGYVGNTEVATTEITLTNVNDGAKGEQGPKGDKGDDGAKGDKGETGNGIANTVITYGLSTSETTEPATWASNMPVLVKGMYLWTRTVQIYTNGTSSTSYQKSYIAKDGAQGLPGTPGKDAQTQYTHIAYADNATGGGFSLTDNTKAYWGMYQDFNAANSNDPTKYKWSKWKGDQGLPGKPGADGKTSYFHMAYAESADGRTGFSFKESGQQYQGYYTDFTQTSSTDPTKYTWMDRRAGIEVDFRNLLSKTNRGKTNWSWTISSGGTTAEDYNVDGINAVKLTRTSDASFSWAYIQYQGLLRNLIEPNTKYTLSFDIKPSVDVTFEASLRRGDSGAPLTNSTTMNKATANQWNKVSCVLTSETTLSDDLSQVVYLQGMPVAKGNYLIIKNIKLGKGNVPTPWIPALEDTQDQIDSKADQTLTQEQLNALEAKRLQMETEMKALATLQQVSELETFINNLKKEDLDGRQKIIEITKAIEERVKDIEPIMEYSQKLKFMDTYITQGNGGMIIGANDSTTKVVVTPDRISFQSGGSEVAYISQRMLHIDNGVFTMSLQLGHYITRAHPRNEYVNATYFVK